LAKLILAVTNRPRLGAAEFAGNVAGVAFVVADGHGDFVAMLELLSEPDKETARGNVL
jgi:hypothetical protein